MSIPLIRAKSLAEIAALPAVLVGLLGDFLTPVGGAAVVGVLGFLSAVLAIQMLFASRSGKASVLERLIGNNAEYAWWWEGMPPIRRHAFWVALVFGLICLTSAKHSMDKRPQGGYLAQAVPAVSKAQTSLLGEIATNTRAIADNTEEIADNTAGAKRETSGDPRKEIANQGMAWTEEGLWKAIQAEDAISVEMYLRGKMKIGFSATDYIFEYWNDDVGRVVVEAGASGDETSCNLIKYPSDFYKTFAKQSDLNKSYGSSGAYYTPKEGKSGSDVRLDPLKVATFKSLCKRYPDVIAAFGTHCQDWRNNDGIDRGSLPFCAKVAAEF